MEDKIIQVSGFGVKNTMDTQCDYMLVALTQSGKILMSTGDGRWSSVGPKVEQEPVYDDSKGGVIRIRLDDNTSWPHPTHEENTNAIYNAIHNSSTIERHDAMMVASMAQAYCELITHPAFTLKKVQRIISNIRKKIGR
jgi:hypothetical protein